MTITPIRRVVLGGTLAVAGLGLGGGSAAAFEPPADPNDTFTCDGGPVAGHPGANGLSTAMAVASSMTAWSASMNSDVVTMCG